MELDEQEIVVQWCDTVGVPIFHIVNEGKRTPWSGAKLVRAGLRKGVPDLFIPKACGAYHGLFIEMKYGRNTLTDDQTLWLGLLSRQGYATKVAYSADIAIAAIKKYYRLEGEEL